MVWWVTHYPADDTPSSDYAVRAPSLDAASGLIPTFGRLFFLRR